MIWQQLINRVTRRSRALVSRSVLARAAGSVMDSLEERRLLSTCSGFGSPLQLLPSGLSTSGMSIAADGDQLLIGLPLEDGGAGEVYFFDFSVGVLPTVISNPDSGDTTADAFGMSQTDTAGDRFGASVGFLGSQIFVGAPGDNNEHGTLWLLDRTNPNGGPTEEVNNPEGRQSLVESTIPVSTLFGDTAVAHGGAVLIHSSYAWFSDEFQTEFVNFSAVNVRKADESFEIFTSPGAGGFDDGFGSAMASDGMRVVIGAPASGSAYVYNNLNAQLDGPAFGEGPGNPLDDLAPVTPDRTWTESGLAGPDRGAFGRAVALAGGHVLVGAPGTGTGVNDDGAVYVLDPAASPGMDLVGMPLVRAAPSLSDADRFGISIATGGGQVAVGAPGLGLNGDGIDEVLVFNQTGYVLEQTIANVAEAHSFGDVVALGAGSLIVAATGGGAFRYTAGSGAGTPTADAGPDRTSVRNQSVQFNGAGTPGCSGTIVSYHWDLDNNGSFETTVQNPQVTFTTLGAHVVSFKVTDSNSVESAVDTLTVNVVEHYVDGGTLYVGGSGTAGSRVAVRNGTGFTLTVDGNTTSHSGITDVVAYGGGFDDVFSATNLSIPVAFLTGDGDDVLIGSGGNDILVGGNGSDMISAGAGRDVIISGRGADIAMGNGDQDILVAGFTLQDGDIAFLKGISAVWVGPGSYDAHVAALSNPLASVFLVADVNVFGDSSMDVMLGQGGRDWFIVDLALLAFDLTDRNPLNEFAQDIDPE